MRNITPPRMVSFEDALRNLAARLTGQPTTELPRTQEAIVQYMAENIPTLDEMAEAITREVMARLAADEQPQDGENDTGDTQDPTEGSGGSPDTQDGENGTGDTQDNQEGSDSKDNAAADQATPAAANADAEKPKRTTRKPKTTN